MNILLSIAIFALSAIFASAQDDWRCEWETGKGKGLKQYKVKGLAGPDCINECIKAKKQFPRINAVTELQDTTKKGCWCIHALDKIDDTKYNFHTCKLLPKKAPTDLSYSNYKNKECTDYFFFQQGCYKAYTKGRLLVFYRWDIEWNAYRLPMFAHSLVCACADAAKAAGVTMFATHFWGECWEIRPADMGPKSDGCVLADGLYRNKCNMVNGECLGSTDFAVYKYFYHGLISKK